MGGECNIKCGIFKKGFESNDHGYKETGNRRNGYTHKTLKTTMGDVEINAPRDRDGSFDPQLIVKSIICYKNQKHFNQFTMSLLFCVILFYMIFLVSAAASVGTEQRSTGSLVVFASLRSVQSGHPPDVLHPCICPYQSS